LFVIEFSGYYFYKQIIGYENYNRKKKEPIPQISMNPRIEKRSVDPLKSK